MSVANENRPVAIQVSGVKKMYRLGQIGGGTLQADLQSWWARVRGKEDPNTKIGEGERIKGQTFMALNGIDLTIYQGEAVGIIGSNGAGKSTLLKLLSKVTAPTEGEIDIYGRIASMLEVGTGFNGELTGRENVYMNGAILGMTKQEIDAKMEQIIEFSEVRDFIDTPVKRYSSGMFVKLAFSVAAHLDSEIMIMDEVLAVGDMAFQKKCLDKMKEAANRDGRTVLYVSHNMNTIRQLCNRCIVLDKGKVVFEGSVDDAISVYLKTESEMINEADLLSQERESYLSDDKTLLLSSSEYIDYQGTVNQDYLIIKLKWKSYKDKDVLFRIEFSCNGSGVASAVLSDVIKTTLRECVLSVNISQLVPATYDIILVAYTNIDNHSYDLDVVRLPRYKKSIDAQAFVNWNRTNWGYIKLPNVQLVSE